MISQNVLLWLVSFGYLCLFTGLCKNPLEGRKPRQPEGGILHRLREKLVLTLVLAAAWWYEHVVNAVCAPAFDFFYVPLRKRFGHDVACRIANFFQMHFLPFLMFGQLTWLIAEGYLRAKWNAELRAENARRKS